MKTQIISLMVLIAITSVIADEIDYSKYLHCPENTDVHGKYYRNPYDCHLFYRCYRQGDIIRMDLFHCGQPGQYFDDHLGDFATCIRQEDYIKKYGECPVEPLPHDKTTTTEEPETTTTEKHETTTTEEPETTTTEKHETTTTEEPETTTTEKHETTTTEEPETTTTEKHETTTTEEPETTTHKQTTTKSPCPTQTTRKRHIPTVPTIGPHKTTKKA